MSISKKLKIFDNLFSIYYIDDGFDVYVQTDILPNKILLKAH
jgi:hypothetical protein